MTQPLPRQYSEFPDGLRDALRGVYGSDQDAAMAIGFVTGVATAKALGTIGIALGVDPAVLIDAVTNGNVQDVVSAFGTATVDDQFGVATVADPLGAVVVDVHGHFRRPR